MTDLRRPPDYFSSKELRHDLKGKTVRGGLWTVVAQGAMVLVSLAAIPLLARLLQPEDFGLVAMVTAFTGVAAMFVDAGLTMATIQREEINHQQVTNLFWVAVGLGTLIALIMCASSPAIAWFYSEARLIPITLAIAISPFLSGLTIQHEALLRRGMQLQRLAIVQISSYCLSYMLAILIAWRFRSYWALVAVPVSVAVFRMAGSWMACSWRPGVPRRGAGVRGMVGFGANLTGFNFANYFARSGDNMLIGWRWGEAALGYYERAYMLMMAPLRQINSPLAGVMIPALSRLDSSPSIYRSVYFRAVAVIQVISCPLMIYIAVMAPHIVEIVFGPRYEPAGQILRWLAIAGFLQPVTNSFGWLFVSQGRGRAMMHWGLFACPLIVLSFLIGLPWGAEGVARAYAAMIWLIVAPAAIWFVGSSGPVTRIDLLRLCGIAMFASAPTAVVSIASAALIDDGSTLLEMTIAFAGSALATALLLTCSELGRWTLAQLKEIASTVHQQAQPRHGANSAA